MKKRFLALTLFFIHPVLHADLPSPENPWPSQAIEQRFHELFPESFLTLFLRVDKTLPLDDLIKALIVDHGRELADAQLIFLLELSIRTGNSKFLKRLYHETNEAWGVEFDEIILKAGSDKLKTLFFYDILLPNDYYLHRGDVDPLFKNQMQWKKAIGFYDPFQNRDQPHGPLFSAYNEKYSSKLWLRRYPNIEGLLPSIADYVAQEYQLGRTVFYHGQHAIWMFLESIYRRLYAIAHGKKFPDDFIALRFRNHGLLSHEEVEEFKTLRRPYRQADLKEKLLFVNLHPDAGHGGGQNSLCYTAQNFDQINRDRVVERTVFLTQVFKECGLEDVYREILSLHPLLFETLYAAFKVAIRDQENHGRLLIISMPPSLVQTFVYYADLNGSKARFWARSEEKISSDPTLAAANYGFMSRDNQFCLLLVEEFINPDAALTAGVKIVGFDPACYWQTEKWLLFEKKLDELVELIKGMM